MFSSRRCSKTGCSRPASATLTYAYADSQAVVGPLAQDPEPGSYDLCREHAANLRVPRGWEVIRLPEWGSEPAQSDDDLLALANAVREAAAAYDARPARAVEPHRPPHVVELARRGHLTVLADDQTRR